MKVSYRNRHYRLRDGRWHACIHLQEYLGGVLTETLLLPPSGTGIFTTEAQAVAYNAAMFRRACSFA